MQLSDSFFIQAHSFWLRPPHRPDSFPVTLLRELNFFVAQYYFTLLQVISIFLLVLPEVPAASAFPLTSFTDEPFSLLQ